MAKKITVADMKAGLIYRCGHCDAKCDDTFRIGEYMGDDVYLGRLDETKKKYRYYCSRPCARYVYIQEKTELLIAANLKDKARLDRTINNYRKCLKKDPEDAKLMLEFIKLIKGVIAFQDAWLAHKSEYELHEISLKATKYIGDFLETHNDNTIIMNFALRFKKSIDDTNITVFD